LLLAASCQSSGGDEGIQQETAQESWTEASSPVFEVAGNDLSVLTSGLVSTCADGTSRW